MSYDEGVSFSLEVNIEKAYEDLRRVETVLYRTMGLIRRLSGDENIDRAVAKIQQLIATANQARLALAALQAASGPIGWALAGVALATTAVSVNDSMQLRRPRH